MTRARIVTIAVVAVAVIGVAALVTAFSGGGGYTVQLIMPNAAQLASASPVWINGVAAGSIEDLEVRDGKAVATLSMDADYAPLREGTTSRVEWRSALGERTLTLYPGPPTNAEIPEGGSFEGQSAQIEVDQVLAALDPPTRQRLSGMVQKLSSTIGGREKDIKATLNTAGPAVDAVAELLKGVGSDGPAIRTVVTQLSEMSRVAAERQKGVRNVVGNLSAFTNETARQQQKVAESLDELPSTLSTAKTTLDKIPEATDATVPLLKDLRPSTKRLPSVARNLSPVLTELRPAVAKLRPTLESAQELLGRTPRLLDYSHDVVPPLQQAVTNLGPAAAFLRPYAPELTGFLTNFAGAFSRFDSQGQFWTGLLAPGTNAFNESLFAPPGSRTDAKPLPGEIVGQPFTDANGSGVR